MFTLFINRNFLQTIASSCLMLCASLSYGQHTLDNYIRVAFDSNLGLKQQQIGLDKALFALKEARSYYLPDIGLNATYTRANGGRTIDLPIGDLFNPVYSTLNKLTASAAFPQVENQTILLNPDNFYDAKLHTTLPLINMEISYNKRIRKEAITAQQAAINVYKRELVKDVKSAYYRYYQATRAVVVYESGLQLVRENVRVNESLLRNGARNATAVTRARAEKEKAEAALHQQENEVKNAKAYFNFLLNRDLESVIDIDTIALVAGDTEAGEKNGIQDREELQQLKTAERMYDLNTGMQRSNSIPRLNAFLDLGSQAFNFNVNNKSLYYFGGLSLEWDLFAGNRNHYKVKQAELDLQQAQIRYSEAENNFRLQEQLAANKLNTSLVNYKSVVAQVALAERYYNDQFKVYKEGQLLYIELVDARNQWTDAQLQLAMATAQIQIARAELERSQASYPL